MSKPTATEPGCHLSHLNQDGAHLFARTHRDHSKHVQMADSERGERVGRDEITQLPTGARPPSASSTASYRQRVAVNPPPTQRRAPSIRIRRLPSTPSVPQINVQDSSDDVSNEGERTGRRRSSSAPMRPNLPADLARQPTVTGTHLPALTEEASAPQLHTTVPATTTDGHLAPPATTGGRMRSGSLRSGGQRLRRMGSNISARLAPVPVPATAEDEYEAEIVDMLDVVGA